MIIINRSVVSEGHKNAPQDRAIITSVVGIDWLENDSADIRLDMSRLSSPTAYQFSRSLSVQYILYS